ISNGQILSTKVSRSLTFKPDPLRYAEGSKLLDWRSDIAANILGRSVCRIGEDRNNGSRLLGSQQLKVMIHLLAFCGINLRSSCHQQLFKFWIAPFAFVN